MQRFTLRKGLDLPVLGAPEGGIEDAPAIRTVAILGADYIGLKPRLEVEEGDMVRAGSPIFAHKDTPEVKVTSPVAGRIKAINRGLRRVLTSVEIELDTAAGEPVDFSNTGDIHTADGVVERLCAAGLWTSFRTRPYSKVPARDTRPAAIYVTAMDSEPLSGDAAAIIAEDSHAFTHGLTAITRLTEGHTYLCMDADSDVPGAGIPGIYVAGFSGPHPSGLAGTHMHFLEPPTATRTVWTIGYHDVIAIGKLVDSGTLEMTKTIAISGPMCKRPRLVRTVAGASIQELCHDDLETRLPVRMISGSILSGRMGVGETAYLGRYHRQITLIKEDTEQNVLGWILPMKDKYAYQPVLGSAFTRKLHALTTNMNGGRRAMVPLGTFEELMPQDYLPTQLLRALLVMDTDTAQALGALELDEEDLALCGFACPAKYEYGLALRDSLIKIEKEG
ncbi:Na(+)-translocating NADH-quinone reductase subunit A [Salipiger aestuarii]|uniref:Na(+)-translocating NADH-quinone reductase subunit A n=1 Tax=Salipiger aestuarii TaxID=568098 RepID=A0A327XZZ5_9RHOB|nr:Na(+)-translocating NADH-quinone reductase subunit A [Salipiger aestuarii]KAA8606981.1 Na(+)-translocating NADH-quinone reductase subunit A [Salipiger aestuarii]KAA8610754.1 Na(+)-translocating NADH-quinone reductase subunit A [Salipiger aestuarii]KAB2541510.1 Na(+)-translocating NADH-quinone reductase subunit A [Salipiger aestuarii]RAK14114.1 Na(+)-translocating NADH:ubiquinone oxidoreductase A subunit [Salipiger aestuarii]